jgi:hypothetical protein
MELPAMFSIGHLDRQIHTTYRSRGIFIGKIDSFRQLFDVYPAFKGNFNAKTSVDYKSSHATFYLKRKYPLQFLN